MCCRLVAYSFTLFHNFHSHCSEGLESNIITSNLLNFSVTITATFKSDVVSTLYKYLSLSCSFHRLHTTIFSPFKCLTQNFLCLLYSLLRMRYTLIWLLIIWDCKVGPSYVISCIFITGLWKEMPHSLTYMTEGQQTEMEQRGKRHSNKESEISCQMPSERQENPLHFVSHLTGQNIRVSDLW